MLIHPLRCMHVVHTLLLVPPIPAALWLQLPVHAQKNTNKSNLEKGFLKNKMVEK
jgi:hypothetical protein